MSPDPAFSDTIALAKPEDVGMSRERLGRIGELLERDIAAGKLPGAVAVVARHGRVVLFKAWGRRDPAHDEPMQLDSIFRLYSMTKPVVSVAALMLAEEGRLSLEDPVSALIPAFGHLEVAREVDGRTERVPASRPVTVHDLLCHTSGLTYEWLEEGPAARAYGEHEAGRRSRTNAEQAELLAGLPLHAQPGTAWNYSRSTDVVGRVVEVATGRTLGQALSEMIFEPLGMMETGFFVPEPFHPRIAEAFPVDPDTGEAVSLLDIRSPVAMENAGGGLASTASDYARFLHALAGDGTLDGRRLLSPATLAWTLSDHLGPLPVGGWSHEFLPPGYGFGLGFAVRREPGRAPFPGSVGDAYWEGLGGTSFWIDPAEKLYALILIQAPGRRAHYRRVFRQLVYGTLTERA